MMNTNRHFNINLFLLTILSLFSIIYLIYISNKGVDFTDEIYNIQGFLYPNEYKYGQTYFSIVIVKFLPFIDFNLTNIRLLRIVLSLVASFYLAYSFIRYYLKQESFYINKNFYFLFMFLFIGNTITYSTGYQILSYNSFSAILIQLILGIYFSIQSTNIISKKSIICFFVYSIFLGILILSLFLTKFSAAILIFIPIVFFILLSIYKKFSFKKSLLFLLLLVSAFFVSFLLFAYIVFSGVDNFFTWLQNFILTINNLEGRSISYLFSRYIESTSAFYDLYLKKYFTLFFIFFVSLILINRLFTTYLKSIFYFIFSLLFVCFLFISDLIYSGSKFEMTQSFWIIGIVLFFLIFYLFNISNFLKPKNNNILLHLFVFSIPILASIGTNNWLTYQVYIYSSAWFFFIYIVYTIFSVKYNFNSVFTALILVSVFQMVCGSFFYPYRVNGKISNQTELYISKSDKANLYISKQNKNTLDSTLILLSNTDFKKGDNIFSYFHQGGLPYFLGAKNPLFDLCSDYTSSKANCYFIEKYADSISFKDMFVILPVFKNDSVETINCLKNHGADINKMIKLGEVSYSIYDQQIPIEIYSPKHRIKNDSFFTTSY